MLSTSSYADADADADAFASAGADGDGDGVLTKEEILKQIQGLSIPPMNAEVLAAEARSAVQHLGKCTGRHRSNFTVPCSEQTKPGW